MATASFGGLSLYDLNVFIQIIIQTQTSKNGGFFVARLSLS